MEKNDIINAIRTSFKLAPGDDISTLPSRGDAKFIKGFALLVACITTNANPKELREAVEVVILNIKMEDEPTKLEVDFLHAIEAIEAPFKSDISDAACRDRKNLGR